MTAQLSTDRVKLPHVEAELNYMAPMSVAAELPRLRPGAG